ncbi:MAG: DUF3873 family protein [Rikenellaceae bacterium]
MNSINNNGISVCKEGEEKYTTFNLCPRPRRKGVYYQYDYRINGELFSCVAPSLERCRAKRDLWLQGR